MKELEFIKTITKIANNNFLGDDCAFLKDFNITISQDNFIENVHFKKEWYSPFQLGYKSAIVNISDILASGAEPKYLTIGLSLPKETDNTFVEQFYLGIKKACNNNIEIIGGDITSADKIFISICAIGSTKNRKISSRKNAKVGYKVITAGEYGKSSLGLEELFKNGNNQDLINAHIQPKLNYDFSRQIATQIKNEYAMMDTSDGLADSLFKIAQASDVSINSKYIDGIFGAEDYNLVAVVPNDFLCNIKDFYIIGEVVQKQDYVLKIENKEYTNYEQLNLYNHFGGNDG